MFEGDLVGGFVDTGQQAFDRLGPAHFEAAAQLVDGRGLDKKGKGGMWKLLTDMDGAFDLYIEEGCLSRVPDPVQLAFEGTIVFAFIDHFPFREFVVSDLLRKGLQGNEIIIHTVLFVAPGRPGGGGNGKSKTLRVFL